MLKKIFSVFLFVGVISVNAQSDLEKTLGKLSEVAGKAYVAPIVNAFGSNLNSGWISRVPEATKLGFHLDIKLVGMGTLFSDDVKNFTANGQFYFNQTQVQQILNNSGITSATPGYQAIFNEMLATKFDVTFAGPTIVGKGDQPLLITFPGKTVQGRAIGKYDVQIKEVTGYLEDLPAFPMVAPQVTVGTVFGTNVSVRYFSWEDIQDMGKLSYIGVGGIHNPGVWFPNPLPIDIGVGYFMQSLKIGDIFESNATQFGAYIGKKIGGVFAIIPYAGITMESSKTTVKYNATQTISGVDVTFPIKFDLEGENSTGAVVGLTLKLGIVNINADYKLAKTKTVSGGISIGW